ncbi:hypothetical protein MAR_021639 [Mya arenaria]|uniref:Uncharacterized protein n=1 Tax=Mya arenaria TaxID=6604 RepID=A0ABY7E8V1_MYAAR|nr:hypothetical protein MAR_021639 [Mya arenaria]
MTDDMLIWGLWQSEEEVTVHKRAALAAQLRFRKNVLKQTVVDKTIYALSRTVNRKAVQLPLEEMIKNVKALVRDAFRNERQHQVTENTVPLIVGQKIRHCQLVNEERVWVDGKVISQVPGYHSWYNVKYVGDAAIYTYTLMDDYKQGDLVIAL